MRKTLVALLAAGAFSAAQAQAPSWSGFKAGLSLSALNYSPTWTDTDYWWHGGSLAYHTRKVAPAIHVGWDTQIGSMVYGAELEHTFASATRDVGYTSNNSLPARILLHDELKSTTTLKGRMGLAVGDGLIYATAGLAKAKVDHSWLRADPSSSTDDWPTFHNDHTGFVYGFGVEHRLNPLVSLRAEYLHTDIPEVMSRSLQNGYRMEVGEEVNALSFGASFHFGGDGAAVAQAQAPTQSWAGFKAGFSLGALTYTPNWADTDWDWWDGNLAYPKRKIAPSVHAGWDGQADALVYGVELDHTFVSAKRDVVYQNNSGTPRLFISNELKSLTTLRGRVGLAAGDGLVYVTAGLAKAQVDHTFNNTNFPWGAADSFPTFHNDHAGFVYGFGVEHRLSQLLSLRAEYLHTDVPATMVRNIDGYRMEVSEAVSTFNFGASFHF